MLRIGPAGIPLSCKGRTIKDGIKEIHGLGLNAMEIQLIRDKIKDFDKLRELRELAKELDVSLSIHTQYYMDLAEADGIVEKSINAVEYAGRVAKELDAKYVVNHIGPYGDRGEDEAMDIVVKNVRYLRDYYRRNGIEAKLSLETAGRRDVFGSLDEVLAVCKRVKDVVPIINFAHIHARGNGCLKTKEDFQNVFDKVNDAINLNEYYTHFSGVEYVNGNAEHYTPIKKGDYKFDFLSEVFVENDYNITIISDTPLLEHDAMYMKLILERVLMKRKTRLERQKRKRRK